MSNNNEHWYSDFGFTVPQTTFHHQHFQMVDLTTMNFKHKMNRLSPHALPHELETNNNKVNSELEEERKLKVEELIKPKEHAHRDNNMKQCDTNFGRKSINRHDELHVDSDDEEEEACQSDRTSDTNEVKIVASDELTEKEDEEECFEVLIDEHMCNNLYDVCLCDLTNEENKILHEEEIKN